jgi:hypothetical protein
MKANSRNSIRWGVASAVAALALGVLPLTFDGAAIAGKAALADAGGNGRLVAVRSESPNDAAATNGEEQKPPASDPADDADEALPIGTNPDLGNADDGDRIRDDSDTASVDGSANDGDTMDHSATPVATAAADSSGETF